MRLRHTMRFYTQNGIVPLVLVALLAFTIAGCTGNGKDAKETGNSTAPSSVPSAEPTTASAVKYPEMLKYWKNLDPDAAATLKSPSEIALYKEMVKRTGTKIEFQVPPVGQEANQFNLLLASGKLPDVIEWNWNAVPRGPDNAIKDKTIIRLNELIDKNAPNFSKYLKENPDIRKLITTDEGNIYVMPNISNDKFTNTSLGIIIRKDWLDKLKLPMPTTIDDWHTVLKAFKEKDPNGNGKNDELPLIITNTPAAVLNLEYATAWTGAWGIGSSFYQVDKKVMFGPIQPEYKSYLTTMNQWYSEGLIAKDYAATDGKLKDAKMANNTLGVLEGYVGSRLGKYLETVAPTIPGFDLAGAPFPVMKAGDKKLFGLTDSPFSGWGAAITGANKQPDETIRWLDYAYGPEGSLLYNFGVEGESYTMVNGKPTFTDKILKNPDKLPIFQALSQYAHSNSVGPYIFDKGVVEQTTAKPQQIQARTTWMDVTGERVLPPLSLTEQDSAKFTQIMNDVYTFINEKVNKFIMGVEPLSKFDDFVKTLKEMKIDEAIKIQQDALDRFNKR